MLVEFEAFFRQHERMVFAYLYRMTGQESMANDLCQETFVRAWQHFSKIHVYEQPQSWLLRVATNLALNEIQRQKTTGMMVSLEESIQPASSDPAIRLVEHDLIHQTLLALTSRQRAALVLREVYGMPYDEVASALGISATAARMLLWRARERFRAFYFSLGGQRP